MTAAKHGTQRARVDAFLAGRLPYARLVSGLRSAIAAGEADRTSLGAVLGEYQAVGRLPNDLVSMIMEEVASDGRRADADPMDAGDDEDDTVRRDTLVPGQAPSRTAIDDRVDDVVLQALVEEYKSLRGSEPADKRKDDTDLDHFMSAFVGARMRKTAYVSEATGRPATRGSRFSAAAGSRVGVGSLLKDRFVLDREIGGGAMGTVYAAVDRRRLEAGDGRPYVAIKVLDRSFSKDSRAFRTLEAEARKAQTLAHPSIVQVHDFDRDGSDAFIVMELLRGRALDEVIEERPTPIPYPEARALLDGALTALAFAHDRNILHCDVKPSNIFVTEDGSTKLVDFGIASASTLPVFDVDQLSSFTGRYAAPEVMERLLRSPSADVFSMACVVYETLAGGHPFGDGTALEMRDQGRTPSPIPNVDRRPMDTILRGLSFEPTERIATVQEFVDGLDGSRRGWFRRAR